MTLCIDHDGGQCCCSRLRVKWCPHCQQWRCRFFFAGHRHMTPDRQWWRARRSLIAWLDYRIYLLREERDQHG